MKLLTQMCTHAKLETTPAGGGNIARGAKVAANKPKKPKSMFNKVVVVEGGPKGFFFVLHYIPDMQWCHLAQVFVSLYAFVPCAPTRSVGFVSAQRGRAYRRISIIRTDGSTGVLPEDIQEWQSAPVRR